MLLLFGVVFCPTNIQSHRVRCRANESSHPQAPRRAEPPRRLGRVRKNEQDGNTGAQLELSLDPEKRRGYLEGFHGGMRPPQRNSRRKTWRCCDREALQEADQLDRLLTANTESCTVRPPQPPVTTVSGLNLSDPATLRLPGLSKGPPRV